MRQTMPDNWEKLTTETGDIYFWNKATNKTQWEDPSETQTPAEMHALPQVPDSSAHNAETEADCQALPQVSVSGAHEGSLPPPLPSPSWDETVTEPRWLAVRVSGFSLPSSLPPQQLEPQSRWADMYKYNADSSTAVPVHSGQMGKMLRKAADAGEVDKVSEILQDGQIDVLHDTDKGGRTALHYAARAGHATVVHVLLSMNADANARENNHGTALDEADYWYGKAIQREKSVTCPNEKQKEKQNADQYLEVRRILLHYGGVRSSPEEHAYDGHLYAKRYQELEKSIMAAGHSVPWMPALTNDAHNELPLLALPPMEDRPSQKEEKKA